MLKTVSLNVGIVDYLVRMINDIIIKTFSNFLSYLSIYFFIFFVASVIQLRRMLLIKCFRPDRLISATTQFVVIAFDPGFINKPDLDFQDLVFDEIQPTTPIALYSVPGYDASFRVEHLVTKLGVHCTSIAMGSKEGFTLADDVIAKSIKNGDWMLLKNVHLTPT